MTKRLQILGTIATNAIPFVGVIWFGWAIYEVLLLYWLENVAIGVVHAMRLGICTRTNNSQHGWATTGFFCLHYGIFTLVHGIFVIIYFGVMMDGVLNFRGSLTIPILSIFGWQALKLVLDAHDTQGFKGQSPNLIIFEPYPRVFALHVAVVLGGFLIGQLGEPVWALAALVIVKTISDLAIGLLFAPGPAAPGENDRR
ncbi:MAG: hypothetical protein KBA31_07030 [Alphaproteobacteria bacterium]|nr:hypothetical protein [Alphaproteobacteria bacterium]